VEIAKNNFPGHVKDQGHSEVNCTFPAEDTDWLTAVHLLHVHQRHACQQRGVKARCLLLYANTDLCCATCQVP